jgi:hypothetical protein
MKTAAVTIRLFLLLLVLISPCYSQERDVLGWQDTRWGMSNEDIERVYGSKLKKLPKPEKFLAWHADHVIPEFELESEKFTVFFQIDNATNKLSQVLIRLNEQKSQIPREEIFSRLESMLVREYGSPLDKRDDRRSSVIDFSFVELSSKWRFPTTTIELAYGWDNQIDASLLTIRYFPTKVIQRPTPNLLQRSAG